MNQNIYLSNNLFVVLFQYERIAPVSSCFIKRLFSKIDLNTLKATGTFSRYVSKEEEHRIKCWNSNYTLVHKFSMKTILRKNGLFTFTFQFNFPHWNPIPIFVFLFRVPAGGSNPYNALSRPYPNPAGIIQLS